MKKASVVVSVGMVVAFIGCCGLSVRDGQRGRAAREAVEAQRIASEEASPDATQTGTQAGAEDAPAARPRVPAWQDPSQVAGDEAGDAAGLRYARIFALRHAIHLAGKAGAKDGPAEVARAEGLSEDVVWDAMVTAGEVQSAMKAHLGKGVLGAGVVGRVDVTQVGDDALGPLTASVVLTVYGCPGAADLAFLAETAASRVATNLPRHASGYRGVIEYEGMRCQRGRYGTVVYDAAAKRVTIE